MPKKRHLEIIEENILPKALIIGGGHAADYLVNRLIDQGCEVVSKEKPQDVVGHFDYIFQFGNWEEVEEVKNHLKKEGKFLFVETEVEENIGAITGIRVLRAGDLNLWSPVELVEAIFRTIFLKPENTIVDLQKKSKIIRKVPEKKAPLEQKEKVFQIETVKKENFDLVEKKPAFCLKKIFLFFSLFIVITSFSFGGYLYWRLLILQNNLRGLQSHVASSDWKSAVVDLDKIDKEVKNFRLIYSFSSSVLFPIREAGFFKNIGVFISLAESLVGNTKELLTIFSQNTYGNASLMIFGPAMDKNEFLRLNRQVAQIKQTIILAKKQLDQVNFFLFPKDSFSSLLLVAAEKLIAIDQMTPLIEKILFADGKKVYLILFQNNMELRPTGGFIGSYGLLSIENGKVLDFKIEDVYTADGQLRGHIDPPFPIRKYLSQPHWFLRDSNFDPDFGFSAKQAAFFLQKELGVSVDGVIGVNLFFVQDILRVTGPLKLADFNNEEISANNFFQKAYSFSQDNFFPGSTQKKDFLRVSANAILIKLSGTNGAFWLEMLPKVKKALEEKNIMLAFADESLQAFIEEKGFGGRLTEIKCVESQNNCFPDYLSVVEANLGVNKVNYFINKSVIMEKKIADNGEITSVLTLSYENSATSKVYPEATYVNYLRIFVPKESSLKSLTLNNIPIAKEDLTVEGYGADKTVFGCLIRITSGGRGTVKVVYTLPRFLSRDVSSYQLFFQKQGGDKISPFILSIIYPKNWNLSPANFKSASAREGEVYYTTDTAVDRIFGVNIVR